MQHCIREVFVYRVRHDIEIRAKHHPGKLMVRADALSRMHVDRARREWVERDEVLQASVRIEVPDMFFQLLSDC